MPTVTINNIDAADFGREDPKGGWVGSGDIINNNSSVFMGARFQSVDVPQGATITAATLTFIDNGSSGSNCGRIYGAAEDNFSAFGSGHRPSSGITKTTAFTQISAGTTDVFDVTTIVAEIIGRAGWASGNALGFVGSGTGAVDAMDKLNNAGTPTPTLSITYSTPASAGSGLLAFCF